MFNHFPKSCIWFKQKYVFWFVCFLLIFCSFFPHSSEICVLFFHLIFLNGFGIWNIAQLSLKMFIVLYLYFLCFFKLAVWKNIKISQNIDGKYKIKHSKNEQGQQKFVRFEKNQMPVFQSTNISPATRRLCILSTQGFARFPVANQCALFESPQQEQ